MGKIFWEVPEGIIILVAKINVEHIRLHNMCMYSYISCKVANR